MTTQDQIITQDGDTANDVHAILAEAFKNRYPDLTWYDGTSEDYSCGAANWLAEGEFDEDNLPTLKTLTREYMDMIDEVIEQKQRDQ